MTDVVVAMDVGGTTVKGALVGPDGAARYVRRQPTGAEQGPDGALASITGMARKLLRRALIEGLTPRALGIVVPGLVDEASGTALWSANIGFTDLPLRDLLADQLRLPVAVGHDVRAGGLAESRLGAGRGSDNLLFVAIGTGIAAAHVLHCRVSAGHNAAAGEIGHLVVRPDGPACRCGNRGCLEALASATAVSRRYGELTGSSATAAQIVRRLPRDAAARQTWHETIEALADGLRVAQIVLDPQLVVIGGGLAGAGDALITPLRTALDQRRHPAMVNPRLVRTDLGDLAGCLGAAQLALDVSRHVSARS